MVSLEAIRKIALSFPETNEHPHFERTAFRVKKKIFATIAAQKMTATLKFSPEDQSVFCAFDKEIIYPVPGAWGRKGWTIINLKKIKKSMLTDALTTAYCTVATPKQASSFKHG